MRLPGRSPITGFLLTFPISCSKTLPQVTGPFCSMLHSLRASGGCFSRRPQDGFQVGMRVYNLVIGLKPQRLHCEPAPSSGKCTNAPALSRCSVSEAVNAVAASTHSTHAVALGLALLNASLQDFARRPQRRRVPHVLYGGHQAMLIMMHRLYPHFVLKPTIAVLNLTSSI